MKVFRIDPARCNGCYCCQVACKDEHCDQAWEGYTAAQPLTGQFWMHIKEIERGVVPRVKVSYIPELFDHNDNCALPEQFPGVVVRREDGFVLVDPEKAKGNAELAEACKDVKGLFYNEELEIVQGCTGCAHLLDNGWKIPRCVDACPTEALQFGEPEELDLENAMQLAEGSHVYYVNYPKRFVAGLFFDPEEQEVIIGADVVLCDEAGNEVAAMKTDDFGDFEFDQVEAAKYVVKVTAEGFAAATFDADLTQRDSYLGDIALQRA